MKKIFLTVLTVIPFITNAQVTLIPNPLFEQYFVHWGYDSDGTINGQILTSDALQVTEIDFINKGPSASFGNLTGLNDFLNLETFKLHYHDVNTINFNNLSKLKKLHLDTFVLKNLDVTPLTALEELNFYDTAADLPYCPLRELNLSNSKSFKSLYVFRLPYLEVINLRNNTANT